MRGVAIAVTVGCILSLLIPVTAVNEEKYGYITIRDMTVTLDKGMAHINVHYTLDEPTRLIVLLLGKQDLKNRLLRVLNYDDAEFVHIGLDEARLIVRDVSYNYGRGVYWFPAHRFNIMIPSLQVITPQTTRVFTATREIPNGIGYFDNPA